MCRELEKIKINMNSQKVQNHFQNLRDIQNHKAENNSCNGIPGEDRHGNCKTDVRHHKKNACYYGKSIVTRIKHCPHAKFAACKSSRNNAADQHDQ